MVLLPGASIAEAYEMMTTVDYMDEGRVFSSVVVLDDKIYVIGGSVTLNMWSDPDPTLDDVLIYDIATGEQSIGASMPTGVALAAYAVGEDGLIYVIGGWVAPDYYYNDEVQVYDPVADSWTVTAATTPIIVGYGASTLGPDGRIYMFGGGYSQFATLIYDPRDDTFVMGEPMAYGRYGADAVVLNDTAILVAGGNNISSGPSTDALLYNPVTDEWTVTGSMNVARNLLSLAVGRTGHAYAIGGLDDWYLGSVAPLGTIERYDPATGEWSMADASLSMSRAAHESVTDSVGRVWTISGWRTSSLAESIEMMLVSETSGYSTLVIVSPTDGSTVTGVVPVQAKLVNNWWSPLMGADLWVDGELYESQTYGESWVFMWDASGLADGSSHELTVWVYGWDGSIMKASVTVVVSSMTVDEKLDMLETTLANLAAALADLQATADSQGLDIGALQDALDALQSELATLSADMADMDSANADRVAALESQLDSLEAVLADLQSSLDGVQASVDKKAESSLLYAVIGLLVVVIVLLLVMMMMGRRSPSSPPPPPSE